MGGSLIIRELHHRVKNLFAVAMGMVGLTARTASSVRQMSESLRGRFAALARAHDLIRPAITNEFEAENRASTVDEVIRAVVSPHTSPESEFTCDGQHEPLGPSAATSLALVMHELATNAAKYGALSIQGGRVDVSWRREGDHLMLAWLETNGPPMAGGPDNFGFGSQLVRLSVQAQLGGEIAYNWCADSVVVSLRLPLERLTR